MRLAHYFTFYFLIMTNWIKEVQLDRTKRTIIGYFPLCPRGCASCSAMNGCVTCRPGLYLLLRRHGLRQTGTCTPACPSGHYGLRKRDLNRCAKCPVPHCEACFSRSYCTRCSPPFMAHKGECIAQCPAGLHYATYTKECLPQVDCAVSHWSRWTLCMRNGQTCGYKYGSQERSRDILQPASPNGEQCVDTTETKRCRLVYRHCADLLHNSSEPSQKSIPDHMRPRSEKRRRKGKRRRKKNRKTDKGKQRKKHRGEKEKKKGDKSKSHKRVKHRNADRSIKGKKYSREQNELPVTLADLETNKISVLGLDT